MPEPAPLSIYPGTTPSTTYDPNTGTTLYDIDTSSNQVAIQSPPNAGSLVATGLLTVDADTPVGFDIYTTRLKRAWPSTIAASRRWS